MQRTQKKSINSRPEDQIYLQYKQFIELSKLKHKTKIEKKKLRSNIYSTNKKLGIKTCR